MDKVAVGQGFVCMIKFFPIIIQPINQCSVLIFVFKLLLSEGQDGKAWEHCNESLPFQNLRALGRTALLFFFYQLHVVDVSDDKVN